MEKLEENENYIFGEYYYTIVRENNLYILKKLNFILVKDKMYKAIKQWKKL
jgi:hypothetical protein